MELRSVCRTCLRVVDNLVALFENSDLPKKIEIISCISVSKEDGLPKQVCTECVININRCYNFRRVIRNSDLEMKERLTAERNYRKVSTITKNDYTEPEHLLDNISIECPDLSVLEVPLRNFKKKEMKSTAKSNNCVSSKDSSISVKKSTTNSKSKIECKTPLYKCATCSFSCTTPSEFHKHKLSHDVVKEVPKSVCNVCGKLIRSENLKKHISIHTDPPVTCKICGKVAKNRESMRFHLFRHTSSPRVCEICGQVFNNRAVYRNHMRQKHSGSKLEKSFKCSLCGKAFHHGDTLKKHIRSHTGERPYPCQYCDKRLSSSHALKTHIRLHTNEKPYACNLCSMAFPQRVSLRNHLKSKHQVQTEESGLT